MINLPAETVTVRLTPGQQALRERLPGIIATLERGLRYPASPGLPVVESLDVLRSHCNEMERWVTNLSVLVSTQLAPLADGEVDDTMRSGRALDELLDFVLSSIDRLRAVERLIPPAHEHEAIEHLAGAWRDLLRQLAGFLIRLLAMLDKPESLLDAPSSVRLDNRLQADLVFVLQPPPQIDWLERWLRAKGTELEELKALEQAPEKKKKGYGWGAFILGAILGAWWS